MRSLLVAALLAAMVSSASAQAEGMTELSRLVQEFNKKSSAAIREYRSTGDYRRYKEKMEPLLNKDLPEILEGVRSSIPQN